MEVLQDEREGSQCQIKVSLQFVEPNPPKNLQLLELIPPPKDTQVSTSLPFTLSLLESFAITKYTKPPVLVSLPGFYDELFLAPRVWTHLMPLEGDLGFRKEIDVQVCIPCLHV